MHTHGLSPATEAPIVDPALLQVVILKYQLTAKFSMETGCSADFCEFLPASAAAAAAAAARAPG